MAGDGMWATGRARARAAHAGKGSTGTAAHRPTDRREADNDFRGLPAGRPRPSFSPTHYDTICLDLKAARSFFLPFCFGELFDL